MVAAQRQRLVAVVRSAVELTEEQKRGSPPWLRTSYGRDVHLNVEVDPRSDRRVLGSRRSGTTLIDTHHRRRRNRQKSAAGCAG